MTNLGAYSAGSQTLIPGPQFHWDLCGHSPCERLVHMV